MLCYYSLMWMVNMLVSAGLLTRGFPKRVQPWSRKTLKDGKKIPLIKLLYYNLFVRWFTEIYLLLFRINLSFVSLLTFHFVDNQVISESSRRLKNS